MRVESKMATDAVRRWTRSDVPPPVNSGNRHAQELSQLGSSPEMRDLPTRCRVPDLFRCRISHFNVDCSNLRVGGSYVCRFGIRRDPRS